MRISNTTAEESKPQVNAFNKTKPDTDPHLPLVQHMPSAQQLQKGVNLLDFIPHTPSTAPIFSFACASKLQTLAQKSIISSFN